MLVDSYRIVVHARNLDFTKDPTFVIVLANKTGLSSLDLLMA